MLFIDSSFLCSYNNRTSISIVVTQKLSPVLKTEGKALQVIDDFLKAA